MIKLYTCEVTHIKNNIFFYKEINWRHYKFKLVASTEGLVVMTREKEKGDFFNRFFIRHFSQGYRFEKTDALQTYKAALLNYLNGKETDLQVPLNIYGTTFQKKVWKQLCKIPYGQTRTYTQIAEAINRPTAVRAVANAVGQNPLLIFIPCHRVIYQNGDLSGFRSGVDLKKELLKIEGVI